MRQKLVVVNAGGFGREIYWIARGLQDDTSSFDIKGFLDSRPINLSEKDIPHPVIGDPLTYTPEADDVFIVPISDPLQKKKYIDILTKKEAVITYLVHTNALVNSPLNEGVIIANNCGISCNVKLGIGVTINGFTQIGHDAEIGDYTHINSMSFVGGGVQIGHSCIVHPHATILPGIKIGNNCVIGAGSVVLKDVKDGQTVFGSPAMPIKFS